MSCKYEMVTLLMLTSMLLLTNGLLKDFIEAAFCNQHVLEYLYGYVLSDQAQNEEKRKIGPSFPFTVSLNFIFAEFTFSGPRDVTIDQPFDDSVEDHSVKSIEL